MVVSDQRGLPIVGSIGELGATADAWLVDVWGVMHNGVRAFESSVKACQRFRRHSGYVVLLTNAPRPAGDVMVRLDQVGVPRDAYDAVLSSGDVTRGVVQAWAGRRVHHIGPERDLGIFDGIDVHFSTPCDAEVVVCTGLIDDTTETPEDYTTTLQQFQKRNLVMLCANPDLKVERGDTIVYCAGALAAAYEAVGGQVIYSGKPYLPIYEMACDTINRGVGREITKDRVLAIGDGVQTDIRGAAAAGIRSVFIASRIHVAPDRGLSPDLLEHLFADFGDAKPVAAMTALAW